MYDVTGQVLPGADFVTSATSTGDGRNDLNGHGTSMAVDIAGTGARLGIDGLAPGVRILPVRVNVTSTMEIPSLGIAIRWAVDHGAQVIDVPVAVAESTSGEAAAIQYAIAHNAVVVAAVDNHGDDLLEYPAADPGVIGVSAIEQNGAFWPGSNFGSDVVLAAPGAHIHNEDVLFPNLTDVQYDNDTGDAASYVAAAAALVRAEHPGWTAGQVTRDLIDTADKPAGQTGRSDRYGYGIVDPLRALQAAAPAQSDDPLLPAVSSDTWLVSGIAAAGVVVAGGAVVLLARRRRRA